jgi:hypothetical protein
VQQRKYEAMLEESRLIWNEFTGAVRVPESPYPFYAGGSSQVPKTNPVGNNKAKAVDLNLTGNFHKKEPKPAFVQRCSNP